MKFIKLRNLFILFVILYFQISIFASELLYLKPKLISNNKDIYLSDLVRLNNKVEDVKIFSNLKEIKNLSKEELSTILQNKFDIRGADCVIIPLVVNFEKSDLESSLFSELSKENKTDLENFRISYMGDNLNLPEENASLKWNLMGQKLSPGQKLFALDLYNNQNKVHSFRLKFLIEEKKQIYVSKIDLPKGKILEKSDLELKEIYLTEPKSNLLLDQIIGKQTFSNIPADTIIQKKHLDQTKMISVGSEVDIVFLKGNLFVKGRGVAKNSASEGEIVKVKSISNNQTLICRAMEKGVVVIE